MKVKFLDWKDINSGSFYNDEDEEIEISVNVGDWKFEVDGKEYYWCVRREEYFDEDGDGKGDGYYVKDMNDNGKVLYDCRWIYWGVSDNETNKIMEDEINEKFNDEMSIKEFILKVDEFLELEYDLFIFNCEEMDYEKDNLIGLEFEL